MEALKRWVSPEIAATLDKLSNLNDVRGKLEEDIPAAPRGSRLHHGVGVSGSLYEGTAICGVMVCAVFPRQLFRLHSAVPISRYKDCLMTANKWHVMV